MTEQKTTPRKKEDIDKELASAKKLLKNARSEYGEIDKIIKYVSTHKDMPTKGVDKWNKFFEYSDAYKKETGKKSLTDGDFKKWMLEKRKKAGKEIANKKYYVNRINNEKKLPFKPVEKQVKRDASKATKVIKDMKRTKTLPTKRKSIEEFRIPEEVQKRAEELNAQYIPMLDSKGNAVFAFTKDGENLGVMTQRSGKKDVSVLLETKSPEMKGLLHDVVVANRNPRKSDFSSIIDSMGTQYGKDLQANVKIEPMKLTPEIKLPEAKDLPKIKLPPTATLIPHRKENNTLSKRKKDVLLVDSEGKSITIDKKTFKKIAKQSDNEALKDMSWKDLKKGAKQGTLSSETITKLFEGKEKLDTKSQENVVKMDKNTPTHETGSVGPMYAPEISQEPVKTGATPVIAEEKISLREAVQSTRVNISEPKPLEAKDVKIKNAPQPTVTNQTDINSSANSGDQPTSVDKTPANTSKQEYKNALGDFYITKQDDKTISISMEKDGKIYTVDSESLKNIHTGSGVPVTLSMLEGELKTGKPALGTLNACEMVGKTSEGQPMPKKNIKEEANDVMASIMKMRSGGLDMGF